MQAEVAARAAFRGFSWLDSVSRCLADALLGGGFTLISGSAPRRSQMFVVVQSLQYIAAGSGEVLRCLCAQSITNAPVVPAPCRRCEPEEA